MAPHARPCPVVGVLLLNRPHLPSGRSGPTRGHRARIWLHRPRIRPPWPRCPSSSRGATPARPHHPPTRGRLPQACSSSTACGSFALALRLVCASRAVRLHLNGRRSMELPRQHLLVPFLLSMQCSQSSALSTHAGARVQLGVGEELGCLFVCSVRCQPVQSAEFLSVPQRSLVFDLGKNAQCMHV